MLKVGLIAVLLTVPMSFPCFAEEGEKRDAGHQVSHELPHSPSKIHLGFFVGAATNTHSEHTDLALGLDSEFRLPHWGHKFGVGLIGEWVFAKHRETLLAPSFVVHPTGGWKVLFAPGVLFEEDSSHRQFLMRTGAAYDFHVGSSSFSPTVNFDIVNGHLTVVYGLTFGFGFGH